MGSHNFPENIFTSKSEAESVLSICLKYGRSQPKRAYKMRAYKKKGIHAKVEPLIYGKAEPRSTTETILIPQINEIKYRTSSS